MKIAVTSQNRKTVTPHAGVCRKFWIYEIEDNRVKSKQLLELEKDQTFRETPRDQPHALDDINVFITAGMGDGLKNRLTSRGVTSVLVAECEPDDAVNTLLAG